MFWQRYHKCPMNRSPQHEKDKERGHFWTLASKSDFHPGYKPKMLANSGLLQIWFQREVVSRRWKRRPVIDLWGVSWWHTTLAVSGRWGWFTGTCHGGARLDRGDRINLWGRAMGTHVTGRIGAMGLNHGNMWHWLDRGDGIVSWGHATLAGAGQWGWFMACVWHWLERGDGIDSGGLAMGAHDTGWISLTGWWDWFMGVCHEACNTGWIGAMGLIYGIHHGGTRLDQGDGIDLRGHAIGMWHWPAHVMGARLDQRDGIDLWGHAMGVRHWLDVNYEIDLWGYSMGRATGSGRRNWFVEANHGGTWHWLDLGEGIDLCGRIMRARDTGWIGAMGLISWGRVKWQNTIWLLNVNDKVLYGCWM